MNLLAELDTAGAVTARYTHGHTPVGGIGSMVQAQRQAAGATYFQYSAYDHRGSAHRLLDAAGTVVATYEFNAFGERLGATEPPEGNRFQYQTNWIVLKDSGGTLGLSRTRVCDLTTGRFLQRDPWHRQAGGYRYTRRRTPMRVDPDGREDREWQLYPLVTNIAWPVVRSGRRRDSYDSILSSLTFSDPNSSYYDITTDVATPFSIEQFILDYILNTDLSRQLFQNYVDGKQREYHLTAQEMWECDVKSESPISSKFADTVNRLRAQGGGKEISQELTDLPELTGAVAAATLGRFYRHWSGTLTILDAAHDCEWTFKGKFWYTDSYDFEKEKGDPHFGLQRSLSGDVKVWLVRNFVKGKKFQVTSECLDIDISWNSASQYHETDIPAWRGKPRPTYTNPGVFELLGTSDVGDVGLLLLP